MTTSTSANTGSSTVDVLFPLRPAANAKSLPPAQIIREYQSAVDFAAVHKLIDAASRRLTAAHTAITDALFDPFHQHMAHPSAVMLLAQRHHSSSLSGLIILRAVADAALTYELSHLIIADADDVERTADLLISHAVDHIRLRGAHEVRAKPFVASDDGRHYTRNHFKLRSHERIHIRGTDDIHVETSSTAEADTDTGVSIGVFHLTLHYTVRVFEDRDFDICRKLFAVGQEEHHNPQSYIQHILEHDFADIKANYITAPRSCLWVAVKIARDEQQQNANQVGEEEIVGMVGVRPFIIGDRQHYEEMKALQPPLFDIDNCAELNRMVVSKSMRRSGVGFCLLRILTQFARAQQYTTVHLSTLLTMLNAQGLYRAFGYVHYRNDFISMSTIKAVPAAEAVPTSDDAADSNGVLKKTESSSDIKKRFDADSVVEFDVSGYHWCVVTGIKSLPTSYESIADAWKLEHYYATQLYYTL